MVTKLFHHNIFLYAMTGILVFGILQKILLGMYYQRMAVATENMGLTTKKSLRNLKTKFENSFKLNMNVNNIDAFVDKNMDKQKFLGIPLRAWNRFNWQLCLLVGIMGVAGGLYELLNQYKVEEIALTFAYTIMATLVSLLFEVSLGMGNKKRTISANMKDYFGNYFIHRIGGNGEQEDWKEVPEVSEFKTRTIEEDMEYLKKCLSEIASARNIEKQTITKKEEAMLEDVLRDFFL